MIPKKKILTKIKSNNLSLKVVFLFQSFIGLTLFENVYLGSRKRAVPVGNEEITALAADNIQKR